MSNFDKMTKMDFCYLGKIGEPGYLGVQHCKPLWAVPGVFIPENSSPEFIRRMCQITPLLEDLVMAGAVDVGGEAVIVTQITDDNKAVSFATISSFSFSGCFGEGVVESPDEYYIVNGKMIHGSEME